MMMTTRTTTSSRMMLLAFVAFLLMGSTSNAFAPMTPPPTIRQLRHASLSQTALAAAFQNSTSSTSVSFLRSKQQRLLQQQKKSNHHPGLTGTSSAEGNLPSHDVDKTKLEDPESSTNDNKPVKKKKGYQRAEEWDAEQKAGGMTWEQRVQFDGLRMGNGFRQNEILQKHLSSF